MNIEKAKDQLEALEAAINNLIWNFESQTGIKVTGITVRTIEHHSNQKTIATDHIVNVETTLK